MIVIKGKEAIRKMKHAGHQLALIFSDIEQYVVAGVATGEIDRQIERRIQDRGLTSRCKGYCGYRHVSCISLNDVIVHGVPSWEQYLQAGDLVTVDVCASWRGYCADMARTFLVGSHQEHAKRIACVAWNALDVGIETAHVGAHVGDIGYQIQSYVEQAGYGVIRDFCGHGIGKQMHEDPDVPNHGTLGSGPALRPGMTLAIEPMISAGSTEVHIDDDRWTARTMDGSLSAHAEDTVVITEHGPEIVTRVS